jgi:hypothetical protein
MLPDARLIALLRNPVDRAFSHYQHEVAFGRERLSFEEAIAQEDERMAGELERMERDPAYFSYPWWNYTYVSRGRYAEQLERWFAAFPREQALVLLTEEMAADASGTYRRVLEFLGVGRHELSSFPRVFEREYGDMDPATRASLDGKLGGPNRRLAELLGRDLPW